MTTTRTARQHGKAGERPTRKRGKLPPKGTAERALLATGLWSDMTAEEIERIKREIFRSRRSAA